MSLLDEVRVARTLPSPKVAAMIRQAAGVSQARLGSEVGVHRVTVARWETGVSRPRGEAAQRYAAVLAELRRAVAA
ncbi:MAG: helix-turn-helix transcriptional regulator [Motilibacteraceae bacterium]